MTPTTRTALTHVGTALGAATATAMFLATKGVDLYAIIDQVNVVVADITKLVALVMPLATAAYGVWRATTKNKIEDIQADPRVKGIITEATPTGRELAASIPLPTVVPAGTPAAQSLAVH